MARYIFLIVLLFGCSGSRMQNNKEWRSSIISVLMSQQQAWNEGSIERFMEGYWQSDSLSFTGSSGRTRGWQQTLERYKRSYPDKAVMGQLSFEILNLERLGPDAAVMLGRYTLIRQKDRPSGLFSLVWKYINGRWVIVSDHTC